MSVNPGNLANAAVAEAIKDLPARPRVHELAKRSGLSSKELIAALADRGVVAKAANSAVDQDVAIGLLTGLLGGTPGAADAETVEDPAPEAAETPVGAAPLFLEPDKPPAKRTRSRKAAGAADKTGADKQSADKAGADKADKQSADKADKQSADKQDTDESEAAAKPARRSRSRKSAAKAAPTATEPGAATESAEPAPAAEGEAAETTGTTGTTETTETEAAEKPTRSRSRRGRKPAAGTAGDTAGDTADASSAGTPDTEATADQQDGAGDQKESDQKESDDSADEHSGGRRRRRRGRRGRGRSEDNTENAENTDTSENADGSGASGTEATADGTDASGAGQDGSQQAADGGSDGDEESSGSRRRRRRRRRGGSGSSDDAGRDDDPDNTVVHVREGRSAESEVQGIKGSTRLEAKRQRRRDSRDSRRRPQILSEAEFLARRESVDRVMAVRQRGDLAQVALLEDDVLVEHFVSRAGAASMIGNIYLGKVQNVLPSMEAAFVDIGRGRNAVLYAGEVNWDSTGLSGKARRIETALSSGDTVLVQVSKDPIGHKGARLTTQISLPGRFLVYVPAGGATGISRKLPDTERKRLKSILDRIVPDDAGVIIRTAAEGVAEEELARDVERLREQWEGIKAASEPSKDGKKGKQPTAPQQLSAEPDTLIKVIRDLFNSDINKLVIDGDDAWESVSAYVNQVAPELAERVSRYTAGDGAKGDVFARYRVDEQIHKALERKVHLPSGGSLVIDRTEAMTVVDVNTGKYTGSGGNLEETVTKNNLEAAEEIVRQLRLRDIGGIIVVDFIDMVLESNRDLVLRRLTECLGRDRTRHQVAEVTSLGLVQMTRKRMGTGLVEAFSETCEHCHGRGLVLRDVPADHSAGGGSGEQRPSGKKRRDRRRGGSAEDPTPEPIARISAPRGAAPPPLRPGAPVRSSVAGQDAAPAEPTSDPITPGEVTAGDDQVTDEISTAVIAVTGADGELQVRLTTPDEAAAEAGRNSPAEPATDAADAAQPAPAAKRPRRRRAASRPAGPAGSAEPVLVPATGPAERTDGGGDAG